MTQILVVANQKGGVGKTTTVLNLGLVLAQEGRRVLLVDLDPQASLTVYLGHDPYRLERSTYSLLMFPDMTLTRVMRTQSAMLALAPGSIDLATAAIRMTQEAYPLSRLRGLLRDTPYQFDTILIDTPPGLNVLTVAALLAAHEVIIPTQCNHAMMLGVRAVQDLIRRVRDDLGNDGLKLRGVLATFFDDNSVFTERILDELRTLLPDQVFTTVIPYDVHVADAPHAGKAVIDYAPDSPGAQAYRSAARELLGR